MSQYPQFIDNSRRYLADVLREIAPQHNCLSIATGYWDLAGTLEIIDGIKDYDSVRLLIGQDPLAHSLQVKYNIDPNDPANIFPETDIKNDLEADATSREISELRRTVNLLDRMVCEKRLEVRLFREPRLHAKAYIFGSLESNDAVGIIGSSNFTRAGLTHNSELNFLTDNYKIVTYQPASSNQENGHLAWFNELWNDGNVEEWTGDFSKILANSPLGNRTFGAYDSYIKTLMEVFPDELIKTEPFSPRVEKILHPFQNQNALSLRRKLQSNGVAMLSDSVGLGKTVTAAAVINQYLHDGYENIIVLPPAAIKQQWIDELQGDRWDLVEGRDFRVVSQQDSGRIQDLIDYSKKNENKRNEIDLFVVDEAHNLRNQGSRRYQQILELFQENPDAKVLLLTATPINNSLMDFANQIQLGSKGQLTSRKVPYIASKGGKLEYIDFFDALRRITSLETRAQKQGNDFDWSPYKNTLVTGLRYYLVRSTRQGVIKRNAMNNLASQAFPKSKVEQFSYAYTQDDELFLEKAMADAQTTVFENLNPRLLNLDLTENLTQRTVHPLDLYRDINSLQQQGHDDLLMDKYDIDDPSKTIKLRETEAGDVTVILAVFRIINFLGFSPYRPQIYLRKIYGKTIPDIRLLDLKKKEKSQVRIQMTIHNMLHVTWLKRLESSTTTLLKSVHNYLDRLELFRKWLNKGFIVNLSDAALVENEYDEDIQRAFDDYDAYLSELDDALQNGTEDDIKKRGIERTVADPEKYCINQLQKDLDRDEKIAHFLMGVLEHLSGREHDAKIEAFSNEIIRQVESQKYGNKFLVFSFFSDTIDYLKKELPNVIGNRIPNFRERAEFVSGQSNKVEEIARRFSPVSKGYTLKKREKKIDFLFATDVLSEGQNLQDAGILVNYDLHWNPVRMIQRNGRINRLGSKYSEILIVNAIPHNDLEVYLKLVKRLEDKISTINHTVGNDQSVLGEIENPIEFSDTVEESFGIYDTDSTVASKAMEVLQTQDDILDWADTYAQELRDFLDKHQDDGEIQRIQDLPLGKWNYLPRNSMGSSNVDPNLVYGLYKSHGYLSNTGEKINDVAFVKINKSNESKGPFSSIRAEYISEQEALDRIKTTPTDNESLFDNIEVDRKAYQDKGRTEITVQFETSKREYEVKPADKRALEILTPYFSSNLLSIIQNGIHLSNEERKFKKIVRKVNEEARESTTPTQGTIRKFDKLIQELAKRESSKKKVEKVEGVLFYAEQR